MKVGWNSSGSDWISMISRFSSSCIDYSTTVGRSSTLPRGIWASWLIECGDVVLTRRLTGRSLRSTSAFWKQLSLNSASTGGITGVKFWIYSWDLLNLIWPLLMIDGWIILLLISLAGAVGGQSYFDEVYLPDRTSDAKLLFFEPASTGF
jgi:hypothetical protein